MGSLGVSTMSSSKPQIGFCGLGAMGFGIATHLVKSGYTVKGFDVYPAPVKRFAQAGGVPASSLKDSATDCPFYICMVATSAQAEGALWGPEGIVDALPQNATLILASTVPSTYSSALHDRLMKYRSDLVFVDSPVSGGAARAAAGTLSLMSSCSNPGGLDKAKFLLQEVADEKKLYLVEGGAGQGSNMKMVHQVLAGVHILASAEGMGLAARLGLDPKLVQERMHEGEDAWSWMCENRGPRMQTEDYYPGVSALTIILKDVGIVTTMARVANFRVPLVSIAEQAYLTGLAMGFGGHDDSGMVRVYYPEPLSTVTKSSPQVSVDMDSEAKLALVLDYYRIVHLLGAAEAIAFAHHLSLPLTQFLELANTAAGASSMFRQYGPSIAEYLSSPNNSKVLEPRSETIDDLIDRLRKVVEVAREVKCPLFIGINAYDMLLAVQSTRRNRPTANGEASVVTFWAN